MRILTPYVKRHFFSQLEGIWFIVAYLLVFQILFLQLPIVYSGMIALGIVIVAIGLMFFMEGLRLGLMPLGETIGSNLPRKSPIWGILLFAFVLGIGATFAEPAISVLKSAGQGVSPQKAPLLAALLNQYSHHLVGSVGIGVGIAVVIGIMRFFYNWPLKYIVICTVVSLLAVSAYCSQIDDLNDILGLAWDCGAVTTGPVTVPLVLALGIGVCRVVYSGKSGGHSGFGIVTMASLWPIIAVLSLGMFHYFKGDYRNLKAEGPVAQQATEPIQSSQAKSQIPMSDDELKDFVASGSLPENHEVRYQGGDVQLVDGKIHISKPEIYISKLKEPDLGLVHEKFWDDKRSLIADIKKGSWEAFQAILPLCIFLFLVLKLVIRQELYQPLDISIGVFFSFFGMALFALGLTIGLTPLGGQLGSNIPLTFTSIVPYGENFSQQPLYSHYGGKMVTIIFGFFLGYGATLAEPALNALGDTVERITVGAFRKKLLMQSVAIGVGFGIALGVTKMAFNINLIYFLIPMYAAALILTIKAPNSFVNFSWDSAGVTTGPITVPLVLAMGLGIGENVPNLKDGFGILALASAGPILTVLLVGIYTQSRKQAPQEVGQQKERKAA